MGRQAKTNEFSLYLSLCWVSYHSLVFLQMRIQMVKSPVHDGRALFFGVDKRKVGEPKEFLLPS